MTSLLIFVVLSGLFLYPHLTHLTTHTTSINDGVLITWLAHQSADAIIGKGSWYNWPFFHPYTLTATYSDPFVTAGVLLTVIRLFTENVVLQYNLLLLVAAASNYWGMYLLSFALWKKRSVATIAAVSFAFSFLQYQFIPHLHTYMLFGLPLSLWAVIQYLQTNKKWYAVVFGVVFILQALNAPMTAYFLATIVGCYILSEKVFKKLVRDQFFLSCMMIAVGICAWYYLPYIRTAIDLQLIRTIRDTAHFAYSLNKLLAIEVLLPLSLILWGFFVKSATKTKRTLISTRTVLILIGVGAICMLGPVAKINDQTLKILNLAVPLPYAVLYYIVPGIQAFRAVSRWAVVLNFGLALGIGSAAQRLSKPVAVLLLSIYTVITLVQINHHLYLYKADTSVSEIYTLVRESEGQTLAELPVYLWNDGAIAGIENQRLGYQLLHQKALYNGVSGLTPPNRIGEIHFLQQHFPSPESLEILKEAGVDLVLVHLDEFAEPDRVYVELETRSSLEKLGCTWYPRECLYSIKLD